MAINWTKEQKAVIESRNRNLLVSAAAGSGKTCLLYTSTVRQENMAAEATALRREPGLPDSFLVHGKFVIRESQQVKSSMKCSVAL